MDVPLWLLIMFLVGGYLGMWIITSWIFVRFFEENSEDAVMICILWPAVLVCVIPIMLMQLVEFIVDKMTGGKR